MSPSQLQGEQISKESNFLLAQPERFSISPPLLSLPGPQKHFEAIASFFFKKAVFSARNKQRSPKYLKQKKKKNCWKKCKLL